MGLQFQISLDTVARDPKPKPTPEQITYQLRIPQWDDVIHVIPERKLTPQEQERRKLARIRLMKTSPTPMIFQRIGQIATYLDDAEDLISTMLLLGRPIIRKLGPRAVPYLGWILSAVDIAEAGVLLSGVAPAGGTKKRNTIDVISSLSFKQGARLRRVERWMRMKPGAGAVVEGLQAMDTVAGVGLSYGPIVGFAEDTIFAAGREAIGQDTRLVLPHGADRRLLAAKMLLGAGLLLFLPFVINPVTALMVWLAYELATDEILDLMTPQHVESRWDWIRNAKMPQMLPTNPQTRTLLLREGIDPDRPEPPPIPIDLANPTMENIAEAYQEAMPAAMWSWKQLFGRTPEGTFTAMGIIENTRKWWSWFEEQPDNCVFSPNMGDKILLSMHESGFDIRRRIFLDPKPPRPNVPYFRSMPPIPRLDFNQNAFIYLLQNYDMPWPELNVQQKMMRLMVELQNYYQARNLNYDEFMDYLSCIMPGLSGLTTWTFPYLLAEVSTAYQFPHLPKSAHTHEIIVWMTLVALKTYLNHGATDDALIRLYSSHPNAELISTLEDDPQPIGTTAILYADLGFKHTPNPSPAMMQFLAESIWRCVKAPDLPQG